MRIIATTIFASLLLPSLALAAAPAKGVAEADTPYCGVLSFYAAARWYGHDFPFDDLLTPLYVSSPKGSTPADLERAAADRGLKTLVLRNLSPSDLRRLPYPVVLFTRSDPAIPDYNHYVLYVRSTDEGALLLDGAQGLRTVRFNELPKTWGGVGMIVSPTPINGADVIATTGGRLLAIGIGCLILTGALTVLARWGRMRLAEGSGFSRGLRTATAQACALSASALVAGVIYHRLEPSGLLAAPDATAAIDQAFAPLLLPTITVAEAREAKRDGAVLVDARMARDFEEGHIGGSINIPVGSEADERRSALAHVSKDADLVLFCKSAECGYSLEVAKTLLRDGYHNLKMFRGGWDEWAATYGDVDVSLDKRPLSTVTNDSKGG